MFGALAAGSAAGGYDSILDASSRMARLRDEVYRPNPAHRAVYDELFAEYRRLHDYFGRGSGTPMKNLKAIRGRALGG